MHYTKYCGTEAEGATGYYVSNAGLDGGGWSGSTSLRKWHLSLWLKEKENLGQENVCVLGEGQNYSHGKKRNNNNDSNDNNNR